VFANFEISLTWSDLIKRTIHETMSDHAQGLASQLAYYFFLALFVCLLAVARFFPLHNFNDDLVRLLGGVAPDEVLSIISQEMSIEEGRSGGLLTLGLLGALWSSSSAVVALIRAMNRAYDIDEGRPWWKVRLTAIGLAIVLSVLIVVAFTLIVAGPQLADALGDHLALGGSVVWTWKIIQWPLAFGLVVIGVGLVYYYAPDAEQLWVWITPGALAATVLWLLGSLAFRFYAVNFGNYGALSGVILLLFWFYLSGLIIVIGAEMNAEIEHASPWGKAPGEKVPGVKKKIGVAAARAYAAVPHPPASSPELKAKRAGPPSLAERLGSYIALAVRSRNRTSG
jgi:membrane protein